MTLDLNIDLGELPDEPEELYALASVVNVACGGHAGDRGSMERAMSLAAASGARVAAHPSYPDREGFGRVSQALPAGVLREVVNVQCAALQALAEARGERVRCLKLHGALYGDAARDVALARAVLDGAIDGLGGALETVVGPPWGVLADEARARGLGYAREGFADRGYDAEGKLLPRGTPGALLVDAGDAAAQAVRLAEAGGVETLCVHGDTPGAVAIARQVREALVARGWMEARR
ncbi:5-oxoprolinase subunit PxpA [Chondromyces apiculatus]|uniref:Lactam utilization protein LamB n=1 Tax=Chondromyces apiculatus DSM 436 TaxID=1192034 RepID=A0A017SWY0_9BACT|nr:5-oxoprolinase subunit PxpA [Chondromyces apiculatus]EYF01085.1 Lactam utilization protein LamB [Chondromyces apiculatus DSM 436]